MTDYWHLLVFSSIETTVLIKFVFRAGVNEWIYVFRYLRARKTAEFDEDNNEFWKPEVLKFSFQKWSTT